MKACAMRTSHRGLLLRANLRMYANRASTPPEPRPFIPRASQGPAPGCTVSSQNAIVHTEIAPQPDQDSKPAKYYSPFSKLALEGTKRDQADIQRGIEASRRYVREGVIDPKYKADGRRVTALICALPVVIVTSYYLWQRRFGQEKEKTLPGTPSYKG